MVLHGWKWNKERFNCSEHWILNSNHDTPITCASVRAKTIKAPYVKDGGLDSNTSQDGKGENLNNDARVTRFQEK